MKRRKPTSIIEMSVGEAQALRVRCSETLLLYVESNAPVAVDLNGPGDFPLIIPRKKAA